MDDLFEVLLTCPVSIVHAQGLTKCDRVLVVLRNP